MSARIERLTFLLWQSLPRRAYFLGSLPGRALLDGMYLVAWPRAALAIPGLSLGLGFLTGTVHPGFGRVYTESAPVVLISGALGALSAQAGLFWTLAYVAGDLSIGADVFRHPFQPNPWPWFGNLTSLLLAYFLLAMLTVFMPIVAAGIRLRVSLPLRTPRAVRLVLEALLFATTCAILTYSWTVSMPVLIRPVFTWRGELPPIDAMVVLQRQGDWIAVFVGLVALARIVLETRALRSAGRQRLMTYVLRVRTGLSARRKLPPYVGAVLASLLGTMVLAGALSGWLEAVLLGLFLLLANLAQRGLVIRVPNVWTTLVNRLPFLFRLLLIGAGTWAVARLLVPLFWTRSGDTFLPVVLCVTVSFGLAFLLLPPAPREL